MSKLFIFFTIVMTIYFCPCTAITTSECVNAISNSGQNISPTCITNTVCKRLREKNIFLAECSDPNKLIMTEKECRQEVSNSWGPILNLSCQRVLPPTNGDKLEAWCNEHQRKVSHGKKQSIWKKAKKALGLPNNDYPKECPPVDNKKLRGWCLEQQDSNILFIRKKCKSVLRPASFGNSINAGAAVPASPYGGSPGHGSGNFGASAEAGQGGSPGHGIGNFGASAGAGQGGSSALGSGNFDAPAAEDSDYGNGDSDDSSM